MKAFAPLALAVLSASAHASCGAAFCTINTDWDMQGAAAAGTTRLDLRFEYLPQKSLREGSGKADKAALAADPETEHLERRTLNRNWVATVDHTFNERWGVSLSLPLVGRSHDHIGEPAGEAEQEHWNFNRLGDAKVVGRYRLAGKSEDSLTLRFGLKLPTGSFKVSNGEERAERTLQPGTGTTDAILGLHYASRPHAAGLGWFASAEVQSALGERQDFRPGNQLSLSAGLRYPLADALVGQLQLNAVLKGRDRGDEAEPDESGSRILHLSPGLSYALTPATQVYAYAQAPLYRHYHGTQLSADWSAVAGVSLQWR